MSEAMDWPARDTPLAVEDDDGIQEIIECRWCRVVMVLAWYPERYLLGVVCDDCADEYLSEYGL